MVPVKKSKYIYELERENAKSGNKEPQIREADGSN
jgi:hypothetical protein